ncbi:g8441 [Coccomyxa elongata]
MESLLPATGCPTLCLTDLSAQQLRSAVVLLRADFNVPLDAEGNIMDDTRLRESVPTIRYLVKFGARVLLASHLGRPKGIDDNLRLALVAPRLAALLRHEVMLADDCIGPVVAQKVAALKDGEVLLLENTRFYKGECDNDLSFAQQLAAPADLYVNDAFGCAHRAHASTAGVAKFLQPAVAGLLMKKELDYLCRAITAPTRPFAAIVGGSKVSSKISVLESLITKCDKLLIGGGMVFTFLAARGLPVGSSWVESDKLDVARKLEEKARACGVELLLPNDVIVADMWSPEAATRIVSIDAIPDGWMGLDIGPASVEAFKGALQDCKTILWNGPMGVFEWDKFASGTMEIAHTLADLTSQGAITIIGGGDSVCAAEKAGVTLRMSHISTGGGASLELIEGRTLPGVAALTPRPTLPAMLGQYLYHLACSTMYGILGTILHRDTAGVSLEAAIAQEGSVKGSRLPRTSSRPQLASV